MHNPPSPEEINQARQKINDAFQAGHEVALAQGNALLIVIGENHLDRGNLLLSSIAINAAERIGIQNYCDESDEDYLKQTQSKRLQPIGGVSGQFIVPLAEISGMRVIPIDKPGISMEYGLTEKGTLDRENHMREKILSIKDNKIVIVGKWHLPAFLESEPLKKDHVIVAINFDTAKDAAALRDLTKERAEYVATSKIIKNISLTGDARELGVWDLMALAVGKEKTDALKTHLINKKQILSDEQIKTALRMATKLIQHEPENPDGYALRAMIYTHAQDYEKASEDYKSAIRFGKGKEQFVQGYIDFVRSLPPSAKEKLTMSPQNAFIKAPRSHVPYSNLVEQKLVPSNLEQSNPKLYEHLNNGGVAQFIAAGKTSFKELEELFTKNPDALYALRHSNFIDAVHEGLITIKQVGFLSEEQLGGLKSKESGLKLREKIESYIGTGLSPSLPDKTPTTKPGISP